MSEIRDIINEKNVIIASAQGKPLVSRYELCEEHAFPHLLHKSKFGFNVARDIPISPACYFSQRLLHSNQCFAPYADYVCC